MLQCRRKAVTDLLKGCIRYIGAVLLTLTALLLLPMAAVLCVQLVGAGLHSSPFDPETEGVVDVIVQDFGGGSEACFTVNAEGRKQETAPFTSGAAVLLADDCCFDTYLAQNVRGGRAFLNRLTDVLLYDESGQEVPADPEVIAVMKAAAGLEHDLFGVRIFRADGACFVSVLLNVNWVIPCDLYYYDPVRDGLVEVCSFTELEVTGLRVRDLTPLRQKPLYTPARAGGSAATEEAAGIIRDRVCAHRGTLQAAAELLLSRPALLKRLNIDLQHLWQFPDQEAYTTFADRIRTGSLTEAEQAILTAMDAAFCPSRMGPMPGGGLFIQLTHIADDGSGVPVRLCYLPGGADAATATAWTHWEDLGGGWYMGVA